MNDKRYLYHSTGANACNKKALIYNRDDGPYSGDRIKSADFTHLDGSEVKYGSRCVCDGCGRPMKMNSRDVH